MTSMPLRSVKRFDRDSWQADTTWIISFLPLRQCSDWSGTRSTCIIIEVFSGLLVLPLVPQTNHRQQRRPVTSREISRLHATSGADFVTVSTRALNVAGRGSFRDLFNQNRARPQRITSRCRWPSSFTTISAASVGQTSLACAVAVGRRHDKPTQALPPEGRIREKRTG
jgi:hypothetical protein